MLKLLAAAALVLGLAAASDVVELTDANFEDGVKEHEVILMEFYAPWCGHCKRLAPEYEKAATKLKSNDPPVALGKMDCTVEKTTCDKFGVSGFPTLKIFRNGELSSDYEGPREADGIVKFMRGQVGPSSKELKSVADVEKFVNNEEHAVIGFFAEDSKLKDSFQKVADTERDRYRFAFSTDAKVLKKYDFNDDIVIFHPPRLANKFEPAHVKYDGNYDTDKIKRFLESDMQGLCGVRSMDNAASFKKPLIVAYYNVDYVKDPKGTNYWRNRVLKVAQDFKRKLHFAVANRDDFTSEMEEYGVGGGDQSKPRVAAHGAGGEKFPMSEEFSVAALKQFAQDVLDGKVEAHMKSEDVPSEQGPVKVLVGKNFKDIVDGSKDALVEFYAPWCGHCKSLAPVYDELGEKMEKEDVVIAKMDATANDVPPQFQVQGFPTLYWVPKGGSPRQYQGGRSLDDFVKYIAKEATDELKGYKRDGKKKKKTEL